MEQYTIEDIELLRQKGGLSYQEAVALLDYHSGSIARALIDLEKHGKLKSEQGKEGTRQMETNGKKSENKTKVLSLLQKLYRSRVKIRKGETGIFNVSVLFAALCLLFAPHMTIAGVIVSMILGYQFSFSGMDPDFSSDSLEKMVKSAAQNAKSSVSSVVQTITNEAEDRQTRENVASDRAKESASAAAGQLEKEEREAAQVLREQAQELENTMDSFFESNPAATTFHSAYSAAASSVPTIQVPVQAETRDGEVTTEADDQDGYSSVTIG